MADERRRVCIGQVVGAHGVRGEVRIKVFADDPLAIAGYGPLADESGRRRFRLLGMRPAKGVMVARLEGVADRNAAEALRGVRLYVPRAALPETEADEFYHVDLIGLAAYDEEGGYHGRVVAVHNFGAGDILEIAPAAGGPTELLPFTREVVPEVDIEGGRLTISPPAVVEAEEEERE